MNRPDFSLDPLNDLMRLSADEEGSYGHGAAPVVEAHQ